MADDTPYDDSDMFYHDSFFPIRSWSRYSGNRLAFIAWCGEILTERGGWHDGVIMCKDGCHDDFSLSQRHMREARALSAYANG